MAQRRSPAASRRRRDARGLALATETTALGAALLAGVGAWTQDDVARRDGKGARYEPRMGDDERYELIDDWRRAVARSRGWAQG